MGSQSGRRVATVLLGVVVVLLGWGAAGWAHAEVEIDNPVGGATNVTMRVTAEAESSSAGIASVRMVLPAGIDPAAVTLTSGPSGWKLTPGSDGFTVAGAALRVKTDAKFAVKLAALPAAGGVLAFKTLVTYSDGTVDRWIEVPSGSNTPPNPAPTVSVRPGAAPAPPASPSPAASVAPSPSLDSPSPATADPAGGSGATPWIIAIVAVVVVAGAAAALLARRNMGRSRGQDR
jgi:hypothetical protein